MNGKGASLIAIPVLAVAFVVVADDPPKEHPEISSIKKLYQSEMEPVMKRYRSRLEVAQKELTRKADLEGALAVKAELARIGSSDQNAAASPNAVKGNWTSLKGNWTVKYSGGSNRTYSIHEDGTVQLVEAKLTGRLSTRQDETLLDFNDGKIERLALKQVLFVEHFDPKTSYSPGAKSSHTGFGDRSK